MQQLRSCTEAIAAPFVRSAFVGNAGVVEFQKGTTLALKAETHNHPSAVEPFGGANTGVGGVIRDILGIAHKPIAVTDILCFGPTDLPLSELPDGSLHPRRVEAGVIDGVADYGNKIGLPTVAGAILYDRAYTTNPLVFAGCIGSAPTRALHEGPHAGDRVIVLGGATGRDGIRGATFSSATMDATTGEVAGASVQIGDPIVEKLLIDVLVGAEDMYSAITDCGAGGLSSAIGEMAEGVGADVDLALVPRKYPGLEPWEVWLSEAQERMVVSVPPRGVSALAKRCDKHGVGWSDVGSFTGDGILVVRHGDEVVARLDTEFLARRTSTTTHGRVDARSAAQWCHDREPSTTRQRRSSRCSAIRTSPRRPRRSTATTTRSSVPRSCARWSAPHPTVPPTAWSSLSRPTNTASRSGSASTRGTACTTPRPWPSPPSTRRSATSSPSAPTRTGSRCSTTSPGAIRGVSRRWAISSQRSTAAVQLPSCSMRRSCRGRTRSTTSTSAETASATLFRRRSSSPRSATFPMPIDASHPTSSTPGNVLMLIGSTETEFAGSHFDLVHGEPDDPGVVPAPDTDAAIHYRHLHAAMQAGLHRLLPRHQRGRSCGRTGRDVYRWASRGDDQHLAAR